MRDPSLIARERRLGLLRSALLVASPTSFVVLEALDIGQTFHRALPEGSSGVIVAALLALAALAIRPVPFLGRCAASLAAFLLAAAGAFVLTHSPALALTALRGLAAGVAWLWYDELPLTPLAEDDRPSSAGVGPDCSLALLAWFLVGPARAAHSDAARIAAVIAIALCMIAGARRVLGHWSARGLRLLVTALLSLPPVVSLAAMALGALHPGHGINILAVGPGLLLLWAWTRGRRPDEPSWWGAILEHPARLLVVTFVSLSSIGAALLSLPRPRSLGCSPAGRAGRRRCSRGKRR